MGKARVSETGLGRVPQLKHAGLERGKPGRCRGRENNAVRMWVRTDGDEAWRNARRKCAADNAAR